MPQPRRDAELRQAREHLLESLALRLKQRGVGIVGRREMRVDRDDFEIAAGDQLGQRELEVVVAQPEAVHAGVDLQMTAQPHAVLRGRGLQRSARAGRRDRRREVVLEHAVDVADAQARRRSESRRVTPALRSTMASSMSAHARMRRAGLLQRERRRPARHDRTHWP